MSCRSSCRWGNGETRGSELWVKATAPWWKKNHWAFSPSAEEKTCPLVGSRCSPCRRGTRLSFQRPGGCLLSSFSCLFGLCPFRLTHHVICRGSLGFCYGLQTPWCCFFQSSDMGVKQKSELNSRLEEKTNQMAATIKQLEQRYRPRRCRAGVPLPPRGLGQGPGGRAVGSEMLSGGSSAPFCCCSGSG